MSCDPFCRIAKNQGLQSRHSRSAKHAIWASLSDSTFAFLSYANKQV